MDMGNPKQVAYAFSEAKRYLIAPDYLNVYFMIIKYALLGISIAFAVLAVLTFPEHRSIFTSVIEFVDRIWQVGLMIIGMLTIIFATISHYNLKGSDSFDEEQWSVKDLEKAPLVKNEVKPLSLIIEVLFIFVFMILINSYSLIMQSLPKLQMTFNYEILSPFIIWINMILIANLFLNIALLIKREWSKQMRISAILIDLIKVMIFGIVAFSSNIFIFTNETILSKEVIESINVGTSIGFRIGFLAVFIIIIIESFQHLKVILKK